MRVSIAGDSAELAFGRGMILERIRADALSYGDDFPGRARDELIPEIRRITLEGYLIATGGGAEQRRQETELRRRMLASVTAPGNSFRIRVGDRIAECSAGELVFDRCAPFSGDEAEHFTLRAVIDGGFFRGETVTAVPKLSSSGLTFPLWAESGITVGEYGSTTVIRVKNGGDVPAGFTAELRPATTVYSFRLEDSVTGKFLSCPHGFGSGDLIRISTLRDSLYFNVLRGGVSVNLTGYTEEGSELFLLPVGETVLTLGDVSFSGSLSFRESFVTF